MATKRRGKMPQYLDRMTQFFWHVHIPDVDFHLEWEQNSQQFQEAHWLWMGGMHNGITPWFKDHDNDRYISTRQWIIKQLHPNSDRLGIEQDCEVDLFCVNPFHMTQTSKSPRGRPRTIPFDIEFIEVANRPRLLHHSWTNLMRVEEETSLQRADSRHFS